MLPDTSLASTPRTMYSIASVTTRLGTRATVVISPLTAPMAAPSATAITNPDHTGMCWCRNRLPTTKAHKPSTDPTDRSTLRVTMTSVSPTPSSAISDAPVSNCCTLLALAKLWSLSVAAANTTSTSTAVPASLARRMEASLGAVSAARAVTPRPSRLARSRRA